MRMDRGLIHLYHGDGKGKTTAAIGLAMRMTGYKKRVLFAQFLKNDQSGEVTALKESPYVTYFSDLDMPKGFYYDMNDEQKQAAENAAYATAQEVINKLTSIEFDMNLFEDFISKSDKLKSIFS